MSKSNQSEGPVTITEIKMTTMRFNIIGVSPLVPHALSHKAQGQLLFPPLKKNAAEKASTMKHAPWDEFRDAAYKFQDHDNQPTRLYIPGTMFHSAMAAAAIDMVGAKKAQIGRLTNVPIEKIVLFGVPKIWSTMVRSSDQNRTPDIRTLPILPKWACVVEVDFVNSLIKETSIANLLSAAGHIIGIGDGRPQKGKLSMGRFRICNSDDQDFKQVVAAGIRKAQDAALANPDYYDIETERLLEWFKRELTQRSAAPAQSPRSKKQTETVVIAGKGNGKRSQASL